MDRYSDTLSLLNHLREEHARVRIHTAGQTPLIGPVLGTITLVADPPDGFARLEVDYGTAYVPITAITRIEVLA
jgi:hypothetical protein